VVASGGGPLPSGHPAAVPWGPSPTAEAPQAALVVASGGGPLPHGGLFNPGH